MLRKPALIFTALLTLVACKPAPETQTASEPAVQALPIPAAPGAAPADPQPAEEAVKAALVAEPEVAPPPKPKTQEVAGDLTCSGVLARQAVEGKLVVPTGANCRLFESQVNRGVELQRGSALTLADTQVGGNLQGSEVYNLEIEGGRIKGNVELSQGQTASLTGARIDGDLDVSGQQGSVVIKGTQVGGDLLCQDNASVQGGDNQVTGQRSGQCAGL
ncbi:hypothetical protein [Deinococcus sp. Marseille-Q6407]|uniref:hypothetical protein n=1 Tax=Deinococcus sp. Marseille-Q6407 TaxID=2969223 RepID=UPI0021BF4C8D|nr:hypothetical protein [Deinococcus sp. Marseille-Q6407]